MTTKKVAASYSQEVRKRAVRLVLEGGGEHRKRRDGTTAETA